MFFFNNMYGGTQPQNRYPNRVPGQLYYKDHLLDQNMTPRQLIKDFPELSGQLGALDLFGMTDRKLSSIIGTYGLQNAQSLIDRMTK